MPGSASRSAVELKVTAGRYNAVKAETFKAQSLSSRGGIPRWALFPVQGEPVSCRRGRHVLGILVRRGIVTGKAALPSLRCDEIALTVHGPNEKGPPVPHR
ncbi:hypothetical protein GCM10017687_34230 [Streptomyces echinatus]